MEKEKYLIIQGTLYSTYIQNAYNVIYIIHINVYNTLQYKIIIIIINTQLLQQQLPYAHIEYLFLFALHLKKMRKQ